MSTGGEPFSYFRTSGLCVICNYVLHTLEYCTSSTRRILMFRTFALPKNRVEIWRATVATAAQTTSFFLSLFSDSSFFFILSSYVHKIPWRKTVVRNENRPIRGGYGIVSQLKQACASPDSGLAQREKRHYYPYPIRRRKYITT